MKTTHLLVIVLATAGLLGCQQAATTTTEDAHAHKHESLSVMVGQIKGFRDAVKNAFEAGTPNDCDGALHDASHVLEEVSHATDFAQLSAEDQGTAKASAKTLFDGFMKVHDGFHGGEVDNAAYDSVKADMDTAIETLESLAAKTSAP